MTTSTNPEASANAPAGFFRRIMALIYDFFLMLGIAFAYGVAITLLRKLFGFDALQPTSTATGLLTLTGLWLACSWFYVWCWQRSGQTLGMKSWRIQLQNQQAVPLSRQQCWLRCVVTTLTLGLGYIWVVVDRKKLTIQDRLTATQVVVLPKPGK